MKQARQNIFEAQNRLKQQVDKHRQEVIFKVGDLVMLATRHLQLPGVRKLTDRRIGPFPVSAVIGPTAFQLTLPDTYKIHNFFHTSALKLYRGTPPTRPPPDLTYGAPEFEVEAILRHRQVRRKLQFLVLWKGFLLHDATWEPLAHMEHCQDLLCDYCRQHALPIPGFEDKATMGGGGGGE